MPSDVTYIETFLRAAEGGVATFRGHFVATRARQTDRPRNGTAGRIGEKEGTRSACASLDYLEET